MTPTNNVFGMRYILDIETVPIGNAAEYLDLSDISAPSNWKDPIKIAEYCKEKQAEMVSKAALDLDLCRVVAMGWMREDWNDPVVLVIERDEMEAHTIRTFWDELDNRVTVGYNSIGFDLPILLRRSLYLGVHAPMLNLDKYRSPHLDLQQKLSFNGTKPYRSLNWYCKRMGLDVPCDTTSGKDIGQLVAEGQWEAVGAHCRSDVLKTKALAERLGLFAKEPAMQEAAF